MKKSEITVTMPMFTYEEFEDFKAKYWELKNKIKDLVEKSNEEGIDYLFDMNKALNFIREVCSISENSNIQIIFDGKIGGR